MCVYYVSGKQCSRDEGRFPYLVVNRNTSIRHQTYIYTTIRWTYIYIYIYIYIPLYGVHMVRYCSVLVTRQKEYMYSGYLMS